MITERMRIRACPASAWLLRGSLSTSVLSNPVPRLAAPGYQRRVGNQATGLSDGPVKQKHNLVFLGTPEFAATVLKDLLKASLEPNSLFQIAAVVAKPSKAKVRNKIQLSPVEVVAREYGLPNDRILLPDSAKEEAFLSSVAALSPDLCVTAAYGNMLPQAFLDLPRCGTVNIHPSLLPKYRGAAPVPRAIMDGLTETGVSLAFTVLKCDAGPIIAQQKVPLSPDIQAPALLHELFILGSGMLRDNLPLILSGQARSTAQAQDESQACHAAKMTKEEGLLDFSAESAQVLHNRVRALAGWPGCFATFKSADPETGAVEEMRLSVVRTRLGPASPDKALALSQAPGGCAFAGDALLVRCAGDSALEILEVQPLTRKPMGAKSFKNGLRGRQLSIAQ